MYESLLDWQSTVSLTMNGAMNFMENGSSLGCANFKKKMLYNQCFFIWLILCIRNYFF